jgi:PHD/YefM family antitoxin component YafN of YafNO toxin-antitoxin module
MHVFSSLILEGYMMALMKQADFFYLFYSHARDSSGMPDPNGIAVVMKLINILELEQYLYSLSMTLHANLFEIVPVQLNICKASEQKSKCVQDRENVQKKRLLVENEGVKHARLKKASEYKKRKQSEETDSELQIRLQKMSESIKQKRSEETNSEKRIRLQSDSESKKRKRSEETDSEQKIRLQSDSESKKRKRSEETDTSREMRLEKDRLNKKQKRAKKVSHPQHEILNQQDYLIKFDNTSNGGIEEQCWAKANNKFNKSVYVMRHGP